MSIALGLGLVEIMIQDVAQHTHLQGLETISEVFLHVGVHSRQKLERQMREVFERVRLDHIQTRGAAVRVAVGYEVDDELWNVLLFFL